ncbi:MAG: hypothetical protein JWO08_3115 [Verrucomicrobiaceae bacterium]|nr:hypothetical protein [Verrucomicrobiaceae bacterium]
MRRPMDVHYTPERSGFVTQKAAASIEAQLRQWQAITNLDRQCHIDGIIKDFSQR